MQNVGDSKSPERYTINPNKNLVVNLNDSVMKPVKRENSNTTHATGITAATASTVNSQGGGAAKTTAFYNTAYNKGGNAKGFFPSTTHGSGNGNISLGTDGSDQMSVKMQTQ